MRHLLFDTETTGLVKNSLQPISAQPYCTELYAAIYDDDGEELETFHSLFKPAIKIPPIITKITGITDETLANAPNFRDKASEIALFFSKADIIVGHNVKFDISILHYEFFRATGVGKEAFIQRSQDILCTVEQTEYLKGHRLSLQDLHQDLFACKFDGAHRAESDVKALAKCYFELKGKFLI